MLMPADTGGHLKLLIPQETTGMMFFTPVDFTGFLIYLLHLLSIVVIWPVLVLISLSIMFSIIRGLIRKNDNGMRALHRRLPVMGWLCMVPAFVFLFQAPAFLAQFSEYEWSIFSIENVLMLIAYFSMTVTFCLAVLTFIWKRMNKHPGDRFFMYWGQWVNVFQVSLFVPFFYFAIFG